MRASSTPISSWSARISASSADSPLTDTPAPAAAGGGGGGAMGGADGGGGTDGGGGLAGGSGGARGGAGSSSPPTGGYRHAPPGHAISAGEGGMLIGVVWD